MKLTQKTLFQCFEKSRPQSSVSNVSSSTLSQIKTSLESQACRVPRTDFLLPVHIRQLEDSLSTDSIPWWKERNFDGEKPFCSDEEFYRICPTIVNEQSQLPKLQFTKVSSTEHQMELFEQYTADQLNIDWKSLFEGLQDYRKKAIEQNQHEQFLWTELYRPKSSKTYLGNHTRQVKRLNEWLSHWTEKLQNEQPKQILSKKRKCLADDDGEFSENSNMSYDTCPYSKPEHPQLIFIHGLGTTSLVHALAEEHNFKITEINASQSRARAPLLKQLEQVTSHHHLAFKRCPSDTPMSQDKVVNDISSPLPAKKKAKNEHSSIVSYFNPPNNSTDEQKENKSRRRSKESSSIIDNSKIFINETNLPKKRRSKSKQERSPITTDNNLLSSVHVEKTSFILFDEIETLTSDENFWSCLKKLLETAKKPIILTSNSRTNPEEAIINLSKIGFYELIHLEPNEPELICCFLRLILLIEMFEVSSLDDLLSLFRACSCDLRQTLSSLQFLVQSSEIQTLPKPSIVEDKTVISKPIWQPSRIFDATYCSHLAESWNESPLKTFFDDLTDKYTREYDRSRRLLMHPRENDAKRIELYDTFKLFMQEQEIDNITDHPSFHLDYRPYIRQICQNERIRAEECHSNRRLRHHLGFRGCTLQWSDFELLSTGID